MLDIHSLTDFKKNTPEFLQQLKETGEPVVLTISGRAELVIQDAAASQKLRVVAEESRVLDERHTHVRNHKIPAGEMSVFVLCRYIGEDNKREGLTSDPEEESACPTIPTPTRKPRGGFR
jgi:hypothetical protein